jgi:hypothetical protein
MKTILKFCLMFLCVFVACKEPTTTKKEDTTPKVALNYDAFGTEFTDSDVFDAATMLTKFSALKTGDTLTVKFASKINDVCSKKGCWMKLELAEDTETMVRFKNYGFFVPLDAAGKEAIVNGKAFVTETSVADLRHYAEDAGKTKEEIAAITASKVEFAFVADGVLLKK